MGDTEMCAPRAADFQSADTNQPPPYIRAVAEMMVSPLASAAREGAFGLNMGPIAASTYAL
jgi:hypothetical protein